LTEKARAEHWVGPVPLGYCKDDQGQLVPSDDAPAIRRMFELYATGRYSDVDVADEVNAQGWRARDWRTGERRLFGRESVRTILKNRAYIGDVSSGGHAYAGSHAPLVTAELYERVQQIRAARTHKGGQASIGRGGLLAQHIRCAQCGKPLWTHYSGRGSKRYYLCSGRDHRTCTTPMVQAPLVEAQVLDLLRALRIPDVWQAQVVALAETLVAQQQDRPSVDPAAIDTQLKRLAVVYADNLITDDEYQRKRDALRAQRAQAAAEQGRVDLQPALQLLSNMDALLAAATPDEQRELLGVVFSTV
jgi:hypothetical protein